MLCNRSSPDVPEDLGALDSQPPRPKSDLSTPPEPESQAKPVLATPSPWSKLGDPSKAHKEKSQLTATWIGAAPGKWGNHAGGNPILGGLLCSPSFISNRPF